MVFDRDPDQDLSNRPSSTKHTRWELSSLVIGLVVILRTLRIISESRSVGGASV